MNRILINAANLHKGGGVQVAASFIEELIKILATRSCIRHSFSVLVSTEVRKNLPADVDWRNKLEDLRVLDVYGLSILGCRHRAAYRGFDVCFTVFGPMYLKLKDCYSICGFAQPWIIYPRNEVYRSLTYWAKMVAKLKFALQVKSFRQSDRLVVELEHVRRALSDLRIFEHQSIEVVQNTVAAIFLDPSRWQAVELDYSKLRENGLKLGFVGRGYVHKNLRILAIVEEILRINYGLRCNFLFTLDREEMGDHGFDRLEGFYSVGAITLAQCPGFYEHIDALIFPSLLECFSAAPIEAMVMKKPVLASDRGFVRDICGEHAFYFDPLNAEDIARVVVDAFSNKERLSKRVQGAYVRALGLPTAKDRAASYLRIIENTIAGGEECRGSHSGG